MSDPTRGALAATSPRTAPDGAVRIAAMVLRPGERWRSVAHAVVAALHRRGWLVDPARLAALEAVAEAARESAGRSPELATAFAALDALPAPTPGEPR